MVLSILGQHQTLATVMAKPPLLQSFSTSRGEKNTPTQIPQGAYDTDFVARLKASGENVTEIPVATSSATRGTLAAVSIDPTTGKREAVNQAGVIVFGQAQ